MSTDLTTWGKSKLQAMENAAEMVFELQRAAHTNAIGMPIYYVDASTILTAAPFKTLDDILTTPPDDSTIPLTYGEGYPTTPDGLPFWERLDGEPTEYYHLFKTYRDMIYTQEMGTPSADITSPRSLTSLRSIYEVSKRTGTERKTLKIIAKLYLWPLRAKAYDLYRRDQVNLMRERDIEVMSGKHKKAAETIFIQCFKYLKENAQELNPKTALEWFKAAIELERLSLGLLPDKPGSGDGVGTTININQNSQHNQTNTQEIYADTVHQHSNDPNQDARQSSENRIVEILYIMQQSGATDAPLPPALANRMNNLLAQQNSRMPIEIAQEEIEDANKVIAINNPIGTYDE